MLISSYFAVIKVNTKSLEIKDLELSSEVNNIFKHIEHQLEINDHEKSLKKIFIRDFFVASLLSGYFSDDKSCLVLIDVAPGSFINKRAGIYRTSINGLVERQIKISLNDWQEKCIEVLQEVHLLANLHIQEKTSTMIKADDWPLLLKEGQIFIELCWKFQELFLAEALGTLKN